MTTGNTQGGTAAGLVDAGGQDPTQRLLASINSVRRAVRRQNGAERADLGAKGERTRARLIAAARDVFAGRDYLSASPAEIAARAGVSLGTFYQYFSDLSAIVLVLAGEQIIDMLSAHVDQWDPRTGRLGLRRMVLAFVRSYFDNAAFYRLWEQATVTDPRIAEIGRRFWAAYKHEIERSLLTGMAAGTVRADLDPAETARALTQMTERYCYDVCVFDPPDTGVPADSAADLITALWADAVLLAEPSARPQPGGG
jgi:AcrR family transcriptional regulator